MTKLMRLEMRENSAVEMGKLTVHTCSKMFCNNLQFYLKIMYRVQNFIDFHYLKRNLY